MIKSFSVTILALICINSFAICQQSYIFTNTLNLVDNKEVLFNRSGVNPSHLTDSGKILVDFNIHEQWLGLKESNNGLYLKGETGLLPKNISVGILFDFEKSGLLEQRSIIAGSKKRISIGLNSSIDIGLNIGFRQARMDLTGLIMPQPDSLIDGETKWSNFPIIDVGVVYNFKNQHVGFSYKNIVNSKFEFLSNEYNLGQSGIIADYQGLYAISNRISLIPEIYGCFTSTRHYAIVVGKIRFKNILSLGLLYNTNNSYGFLINWIIIKKITIGYFYEYEQNKVIDSQVYGSHGLNLGLIIK
jgi:type IX secretion system PorP/SprF family membrane protein